MWVTWSIRPPPTVPILASWVEDEGEVGLGLGLTSSGRMSGSAVVLTTRSLSSTCAQSIHEQLSTSSSTSDTITWGAAVIPPRRPRSRITAHDPRTLEQVARRDGQPAIDDRVDLRHRQAGRGNR